MVEWVGGAILGSLLTVLLWGRVVCEVSQQ